MSDAVSSRMRTGGDTIILRKEDDRACLFCWEIFMFNVLLYCDIQWKYICNYGLLAVLTIFFAVFFVLTSKMLPLFIALALILIIFTASAPIDIQENAGEKVR